MNSIKSNLKVHFAGCEVMNQYYAIQALGIKYTLYTAFPFLERKVLKTKTSPIMPCHLKGNENQIPNYIYQNSKHCIQDSGLFTLMFGSQKDNKNISIDAWYRGLVEFVQENNIKATLVEVDCQKVSSPAKAWELRQKMRNELPNRIINVFHKEDKIVGLDRMIEYSDYIAISVPELRKNKAKNHVIELANYIKNRKPSIDIHLLGCTDIYLMKNLRFCTSCDSTSYTSGKRYGFIAGNHVSQINPGKIIEHFGKEIYDYVRRFNSEINTSSILLNIQYELEKYKKHAGNQD